MTVSSGLSVYQGIDRRISLHARLRVLALCLWLPQVDRSQF